MKFEDLIQIRNEGTIPEDILPLLKALLHDAAGDWDSAHRIAQEEFTPEGSWVHAYLHRVEGDLSNAAYWYHNAGRNKPDRSLEEEWKDIAMNLIASGS